MSNISSTANINLTVNGQQVSDKLKKLEEQALNFRDAMSQAAKAGDKASYEKWNKELKRTQKEIRNTKAELDNVDDVLKDIDKASLKDLKRSLQTLERQFKSMRQDSPLWDEHAEKIKNLKEKIKELNEEMQPDKEETIKDKVDGFMDEWGDYLAGGAAAVAGITLAAKSAVNAYAEMQQEEANVIKYTGMTEEEVKKLNDAFRQMDTRTSREDLNKLAQEAGRLGKTSVEDVLGFVNAADQINVALDDLGEGATLTLSKLTGIFGDEERLGTEKSLLAVGSVINELSQNCSASAPYIAEFASRLGGVGSQAGMTVQEIMGISAVLDTNGIACEKAATAISQVITRIYADPAKYAKAASLDVTQFTDLLKRDANEALLTFLSALNKAGSMDKLAPLFKELGENGSGAVSALSTLAKNIEDVRMQQEVANEAFEEATSITKEADVQNNTIQAGLDKAKKGFNEMAVALGEKLQPAMKYAISGTSLLMKTMSKAIDVFLENKGTILALTLTILLYTVAAQKALIADKLHAVAMAAKNALTVAHTAATQLAAAATALFTGNVTKARKAFVLFSAAIKASPIGLLLAGITAAISAIVIMISKTREAREEERRLAEERKKHFDDMTDISSQTANYADKEVNALKRLYDAARNEFLSKEQRLAAAQKILDKYPEYFSGMTAEQIMVGAASKKYDELTRSILNNAKARAAAEKILENEKKIIELEMQLDKKEHDVNDAEGQAIAARRNLEKKLKSYGVGMDQIDNLPQWKRAGLPEGEYSNAIDELYKVNEELAQLQQERTDLQEANRYLKERYGVTDEMLNKGNDITLPDLSGIYTGGGTGTSGTGTGNKKGSTAKTSEAEKLLKEQMKEQKKLYETSLTEELQRYNNEEITYSQYLERKYELDLDYINKQKKVLEEHKMLDTEEYARLCKSEEEIKTKSIDNIKKYKFSELEKTYTEESAKNKATYYAGQKDYKDYIETKEKLDMDFVDARLKILTGANLRDSKDYISLLKEKENLYEQHLDRLSKLDKLQEENRHSTRMSDISYEFNNPLSGLFNNEKARYQAELIETYNYLCNMQDMYLKGSDEWQKYQKQIDELLANDKIKKQEELATALLSHSKTYRALDRQAREEYETNLLNTLHSKGLISEEEYQKALKKIRKKYQDEETQDTTDKWDDAKEDVTGIGSDTANKIFQLSAAFDRLFDPSRSEDFWKNFAEVASNSFEIVSGFVSQFTNYFSAEKDLELQKLENYYDAEITKAGSNKKKVAKLEEEKEKKVAELKTKYNHRAMKIEMAMAVAETAKNAILAYGAGLKFPFPANTVMPAVLMALAVAQGAIQIATIKKQHDAEAAGYSKGGFTKDGNIDEPAGIVHAGEWVASQALVKSPKTRPLINALEHAQRNNTIGTFKLGGFVPPRQPERTAIQTAPQTETNAYLTTVMGEMTNVFNRLNEQLNKPFVTINTVTGDYGIKKAQDDYNRLMKNKNPKK